MRRNLVFVLLLLTSMFAVAKDSPKIRHVLLISVDGLHALDVTNFINTHQNSAMAELASHGITYTNARTPANSDSFPGLLALVTGGSPISHGLFYDVSYDRTIFDPTNTSCSGPPGNNMVFDESIDVYNPGSSAMGIRRRVTWKRPLGTSSRAKPFVLVAKLLPS